MQNSVLVDEMIRLLKAKHPIILVSAVINVLVSEIDRVHVNML